MTPAINLQGSNGDAYFDSEEIESQQSLEAHRNYINGIYEALPAQEIDADYIEAGLRDAEMYATQSTMAEMAARESIEQARIIATSQEERETAAEHEQIMAGIKGRTQWIRYDRDVVLGGQAKSKWGLSA